DRRDRRRPLAGAGAGAGAPARAPRRRAPRRLRRRAAGAARAAGRGAARRPRATECRCLTIRKRARARRPRARARLPARTRVPTPTGLTAVPPASTGGTYPPGYWAGVQAPQAGGPAQPAHTPTPPTTLPARGIGPLRRKVRPHVPKASMYIAMATLPPDAD